MLPLETIRRVLDAAMDFGDFAEVFCERSRHTGIECFHDRLENCASGYEAGTGVRILRGLRSVYVHSTETNENKLIALVRDAARGLGEARGQLDLPGSANANAVEPMQTDARIVQMGEKMAVVRRALNAAKSANPEISQSLARYLDMRQEVLIANSEGLLATDLREKTRLMITAYASSGGKLQIGYTGPGAAAGFEYYDTIDVEGWAREAARVAVTNLHAEKCRGGVMTVVVDNGFGGLMFHEACGHSLESTSVAIGLSEFSGKMGEMVASPVVTLIDDGAMPMGFGSMRLDDEGDLARKNVLIENGVLKSYLIDRLGARRMGVSSTGSARRQSFRFAPAARMTNTYIAPGQSTREQIIQSVENGLFVKSINGGSVNPATGDFNFSATESWIIENGKITRPVSGATLIGNGGAVLKSVDMVADNLEIRQGYCFASSGALFIGAGQPTIRVQNMTVGGVQ